jgi:hypothetical protein
VARAAPGAGRVYTTGIAACNPPGSSADCPVLRIVFGYAAPGMPLAEAAVIRILPVLFLVALTGSACTGTGHTDTSDYPANSATRVVLQRDNVARFRGTEMPDLLEALDGADPLKWRRVRSHVHPPPTPPVSDGGRRHFDWPPRDWTRLSRQQQEWRSYLLWPEHLRALLHRQDWDSEENRSRLARFGRMYRVVYQFQTREPETSPIMEAELWGRFAETLLAYGDDGRDLLIANLVLALTSPDEDVVKQAQGILVQLGHHAIEPLCAALWVGHRQAVQLDDGSVDVRGNPNFNRYVSDVLYRLGFRAVPQAIFELENGPTDGTAWRFRRHFVELLGRFGDPRALPALMAEPGRVNIVQLDMRELAQGRTVVDREATDEAKFVYREYLIKAFGEIGDPRGLATLLRLWAQDEEFHATAALEAASRILGRRVRTMDEARAEAERRGITLNGTAGEGNE